MYKCLHFGGAFSIMIWCFDESTFIRRQSAHIMNLGAVDWKRCVKKAPNLSKIICFLNVFQENKYILIGGKMCQKIGIQSKSSRITLLKYKVLICIRTC